MAYNDQAFVLLGNQSSFSLLGRNFVFITANLLQLIRISNVDWRYCPASI